MCTYHAEFEIDRGMNYDAALRCIEEEVCPTSSSHNIAAYTHLFCLGHWTEELGFLPLHTPPSWHLRPDQCSLSRILMWWLYICSVCLQHESRADSPLTGFESL